MQISDRVSGLAASILKRKCAGFRMASHEAPDLPGGRLILLGSGNKDCCHGQINLATDKNFLEKLSAIPYQACTDLEYQILLKPMRPSGGTGLRSLC